MDAAGSHFLADIRIRDPFLLTVARERLYYLFGSTDAGVWTGSATGVGFDCYRSRELRVWHGPLPVFRPPPGFWADRNFWAPEVHVYAGRFFMFATFDAEGVARGTQALVADAPAGPYTPWSDGPLTPSDWDCSGGTLHVDHTGDPWIVFSHDWTQIGYGEIVAQRLREDLRHAMGRPLVLFFASDADWTRAFVHPRIAGAEVNYVADGPFVHRLRTGELLILWSSIGADGYDMGIARSETGRITGRWIQQPRPLRSGDGGHGMIGRTLTGDLLLTWHQPNESPFERAVLHPIVETTRSVQFAGSHPL